MRFALTKLPLHVTTKDIRKIVSSLDIGTIIDIDKKDYTAYLNLLPYNNSRSKVFEKNIKKPGSSIYILDKSSFWKIEGIDNKQLINISNDPNSKLLDFNQQVNNQKIEKNVPIPDYDLDVNPYKIENNDSIPDYDLDVNPFKIDNPNKKTWLQEAYL